MLKNLALNSIILRLVGKKYGSNAIFNEISFSFDQNQCYYIKGSNGSGKSTLLKIISGFVEPDFGSIEYSLNHQKKASQDIFNKVSFSGPYIQLFEGLTLMEHIKVHFSFQDKRDNRSFEEIIKVLDFKKQEHQLISTFSSGMKQKLKLALSFCSDTPILLLDEPCSNLDAKNIAWYKMMLKNYTKDRMVIIASNNVSDEIEYCHSGIDLSI